MNWLVDIGLFALVGICSYFGIEHHLDSKANEMLPNIVGDVPHSGLPCSNATNLR